MKLIIKYGLDFQYYEFVLRKKAPLRHTIFQRLQPALLGSMLNPTLIETSNVIQRITTCSSVFATCFLLSVACLSGHSISRFDFFFILIPVWYYTIKFLKTSVYS